MHKRTNNAVISTEIIIRQNSSVNSSLVSGASSPGPALPRSNAGQVVKSSLFAQL